MKEIMNKIYKERVTLTIQEVYEEIGGDYNDVIKRLRKPELVEKFTKKFLDDMSFNDLKKALDDENLEDGFRAVHTLKGVCLNLSYTSIFEVANELTEMLRPGNGEPVMEEVFEALERLEERYNVVIEGIKKLD